MDEETSETVERRFTVAGMPRLRVRNVSGATTIRADAPGGEVRVSARKRVRGAAGDRAKRLLENVEVRMEQHGEEIRVEPHLYEQQRGWLDLFRGGRVAVDFDIHVPREARIEAHTVSGDVTLEGVRGPVELQSVSGGLDVDDVQGPMRVRTVSGDATWTRYAGQLEANTVSGELVVEESRLRGADVVTVSGDVTIDGELAPGDGHRVKTISGDVGLALGDGAYEISFSTMSGECDCDREAEIIREGTRDRRILIGAGGARVQVKTVSGDLAVRRSNARAPAAEPAAAQTDPEATARMEPRPAEPSGRGDVMAVLERLARGELGLDDAATALDDARRRER